MGHGLGWNYFFTLIWIAYMISSGVVLFSGGFLLSRVSQKSTSSCRRLSENNSEEYYLNEEIVHEIFKDVNASSNLCLPKKSRVIILVIDALKYEFGVEKPNLTDPLPFENKLSVFSELLSSYPERSRLMKFRADPPTTTLQRLKGLTTGSLPTFIDIGSNFATPEINEDNIIDQIVKNGMQAVFLGDSTWTELYPNRFKRKYSYPSFDIFDLDYVDSEIMNYLPGELEKNDWDLLIAHFLGVDHCGHKHGPFHSEMSRKLSEMDKVIREVVRKLDDDTMLLVVGDHGMTASGDHGGESEDEINALIFAYSAKHKFITSEFGSSNLTMQQIDLVPTLATIMGVPIPYSNLGLVNLNLVPDVPVPHMLKHQSLLLHVWQNAKQIFQYFRQYALDNKRTFDFDQMDEMENKFLELTHRVNTMYNEAAFKSFIVDLNPYLRGILQTCRNIWVKFDANQMSQGLLITFLPIFFSFLLINNSRAVEFSRIFATNVVQYIYLLNFAAAVFGYRYYKDLGMRSEQHSVIFTTGILNTFILVLLTIQNWPEIATNWSHVKRFSNMPTRIIFIISVCVYFSNSFIIEEQKILVYLLAALLVLLVGENILINYKLDSRAKFKITNILKSPNFILSIAAIMAILLLRFAYLLFRCREEQNNCFDFSNNTGFSETSVRWSSMYFLSIIALGLFVSLLRTYFRNSGNLSGFKVNVILARYGPILGAISAGAYMLLSTRAMKQLNKAQLDILAWVVYTLFVLQFIILLASPLMTFVLPRKSRSISVNPFGKVIPEIFYKMKQMYEGDLRNENNDIPIVYGLAAVYSSTLISFGIFLTLVVTILLEAKAALGNFICLFATVVILVGHSVLKLKTAKVLEYCLQPTFTAITAWFLLAHFSFFATSHQTTMSQIDWKAAFVGRSANFDHSNFLSATLVILNTFGGQIIIFMMYPLLSLEMFSLFSVHPHLGRQIIKKKPELKISQKLVTKKDLFNATDLDFTRGELILHENFDLFIASIFKVAVQIFMLQGIKVFCAMMACTIHCRHLMVWKIFAPRFIYEGIATFVSLPAAIFGYFIIMRVNWALSGFINQINKLK